MEKYQNLKRNTRIALYISMALMVLSFIARVISLIRITSGDQHRGLAHVIISLVVAIFILVYSFWGYRKPHGNLLKYTMFIFGLSLFLNTQFGRARAAETLSYATLASGIVAMLIAYICGRLNRIEKNKILMIVVGVILVALAAIQVIGTSRFMRSITSISNVVYWLTLCLAYIARYEEHKEAGLSDASKAK